MKSEYLNKLMDTIKDTIEMRDRLQFRNDSLNKMLLQVDKYSDYELNEFRITIMKTKNEIDVLNKVITEKENYFKNYAAEYEKDLDETNKNYDSLIQKAKALQNTRIDIGQALNTVKWDLQKESEEARVFFYKRLKGLMSK